MTSPTKTTTTPTATRTTKRPQQQKHKPPASPTLASKAANTAPATKNESHAEFSSHMKRYLQCVEQHMSPSNLIKYCACHEK